MGGRATALQDRRRGPEQRSAETFASPGKQCNLIASAGRHAGSDNLKRARKPVSSRRHAALKTILHNKRVNPKEAKYKNLKVPSRKPSSQAAQVESYLGSLGPERSQADLYPAYWSAWDFLAWAAWESFLLGQLGIALLGQLGIVLAWPAWDPQLLL